MNTKSLNHFKADFDVRFVDLDNLGHINNAVYLSYLEQYRIAWMKHLGIFDAFGSKQPIPLILARSEIDYVSQGYYREKITCEGWVSRVGTKSFDLSYNIKTVEEDTILAKAKSVLVWFDYEKNKSVNIPDNVLDIFKKQ